MFDETLPTKKETILLTIQLHYWQRVLDGIKHYEYRRVFRQEPVNAFVYAVLPVGEIVGYMELGIPIHDTLDKICKIAEGEAPGSTPGMLEYMKGLDRGYAVPILAHEELERVGLAEIKKRFPKFNPPQSYLILDNQPELLQFFESLRT